MNRIPVEIVSGTQAESPALRVSLGRPVMPMDDLDRRELRALCDQFKELMRHDIDCTMFDQETCQRIGEMIGRSARQGRSEHELPKRKDKGVPPAPETPSP